MTFGGPQAPPKPAMTGKPTTTYQPTADQLAEKVEEKPPALDPKVVEGIDMLHAALTQSFRGDKFFTAHAQAALNRIDKVVAGLRGKRE